jgi:hypothetical protein
MHSGDSINEETIVPGAEEPVGSAVKSHDATKTGVTAGWITETVTASKS